MLRQVLPQSQARSGTAQSTGPRMGSGLYKTPQGSIWHGTWRINGNLYCSDWKEGSKRPCMKAEKQGDTVSFVDSESGQLRIKIVKTVPGNAENLN